MIIAVNGWEYPLSLPLFIFLLISDLDMISFGLVAGDFSLFDDDILAV
jgi:hypothetical protein